MNIKLQDDWVYDPAEHRRKHCKPSPTPTFIRDGSIWIGICPDHLTKVQAEALLHDAEFEGKGRGFLTDYPKRIYNIHRGVIYEASPTEKSKASFHGYPWRGRPGRNRLPRDVERALRLKARSLGFITEFEEWLNEHNA